jgi:hypothetical protein
MPWNQARIIVALLSDMAKYHFQANRTPTSRRELQLNKQKRSRKVFVLTMFLLDVGYTLGKLVLCSDRCIRQSYAVICARTAGYKSIQLHTIKHPHWQPTIPPVQHRTSQDRVRPSPVQSSPSEIWTGIGSIPKFSRPGLN